MKRIIAASLFYLLIAGTTVAQVPSELTSLAQDKKFVEVDKQPLYIFSVNPKYPPNAIKEGVEGTVWVGITVNEAGKVDGVRILRGARGDLDTAALDAAQGWLFTPAEKNGKPVKIEVSIPFRFKLAKSSNLFRLKEVPALPTDEKATALGVEIKRFVYNVPRKHQLNFTVERYIDGNADKSFGLTGHLDELEVGKHDLKVAIDARGESIRFVFNDSLTLGLGGSRLKNYSDINTIALGASLMEKIKTPFLVYVAGKKGRGTLTEKSGFQDVLAIFDHVIVVTVELEFL